MYICRPNVQIMILNYYIMFVIIILCEYKHVSHITLYTWYIRGILLYFIYVYCILCNIISLSQAVTCPRNIF